MAYVNVPKDLSKVKVKVLLNLTKRQLICFSAAALIGFPTYLLTRGAAGGSAAVLLMIAAMLPFFFFAMYERDGRPAEKVLLDALRHRLWPGARPYKTENLYKYLSEEGKRIAPDDKKTNRAVRAKHQQAKGKQG